MFSRPAAGSLAMEAPQAAPPAAEPEAAVDQDVAVSRRARTADIQLEKDVDFASLLLPEPILKGLKDMGWTKPSPIQLKAIPVGRFGVDLVAQAKSGTGKTCVFAVIGLDALDLANPGPQVLIIAPTREIAQQISEVVTAVGKYIKGATCKCFIGGTPLNVDLLNLRSCMIAVGTVGRLTQLIESRHLKAKNLRVVIMDEADKLFEKPMNEDVEALLSRLPERKQMLAFSATYAHGLLDHISSFMNKPQYILLAPENPSLQGVKQYYCEVSGMTDAPPAKVYAAKAARLLEIFRKISFHQCLLFTNDRARAMILTQRLNEDGWPARYIAGGLAQQERTGTMAALKEFQIRVLVSTDLTARGIDIDRVNLVINLDMPGDPETYLHRIGRTGRFGTYGVAISFVDTKELQVVRAIAEAYHTTIEPLPDVIPAEYYTYELSSAKEKQAAQKLEEERKKVAADGEQRPLSQLDFTIRKRKQDAVVAATEEQDEDGEDEEEEEDEQAGGEGEEQVDEAEDGGEEEEEGEGNGDEGEHLEAEVEQEDGQEEEGEIELEEEQQPAVPWGSYDATGAAQTSYAYPYGLYPSYSQPYGSAATRIPHQLAPAWSDYYARCWASYYASLYAYYHCAAAAAASPYSPTALPPSSPWQYGTYQQTPAASMYTLSDNGNAGRAGDPAAPP